MIYIFSKSIYRAETWAQELKLSQEQYKTFTNPCSIKGLNITPLDRAVVIGVVPQLMLNMIQVALGKPEDAPEIEFYP